MEFQPLEEGWPFHLETMSGAPLSVPGYFTSKVQAYNTWVHHLQGHVEKLRTEFATEHPDADTSVHASIDTDGVRGGEICRVDFVVSRGIPKIVEFNFGPALGGVVDTERILCHIATHLQTDSVVALPHRERLEVALERARLEGLRSAVLPIWPWCHLSNPGQFFAATLKYLAERGLPTELVELEALVRRPARRPHLVIDLFDLRAGAASGFSAFELRRNLQQGGSVLLSSPKDMVLSDKRIMARRTFCTPGQTSCLPETWLLEPQPGYRRMSLEQARARRAHLVLKPADEHGGYGVLIGHSTPEDMWDAALTSGGPVVLQQFMDPDPIPLEVEGDGGRRLSSGKAVFGLYVIRGVEAGTLVRVVDESHHGPINGGTGAAYSCLVPEMSQR